MTGPCRPVADKPPSNMGSPLVIDPASFWAATWLRPTTSSVDGGLPTPGGAPTATG